jgi:glycerol-3-phosphate acyltransferase PlsX
MRIAVDAMGGDHAPARVVEGAVDAASRGVAVLLVGRRPDIERELARLQAVPGTSHDIQLAEADDVVGMGEASTTVLRSKRTASIRVAVEAVARGEAAGVFSAGHTGATMVAAHAVFGRLPGVDRPGLAAPVPTERGLAVLIDAGATIECRPTHLVQFGVMGAAYARLALGVERPAVGLLSIGEEESKGTDLVREAHRLLKDSGLHFVGNVEARDMFRGEAHVIVCDGFTGNIALKVSEGVVDAIDRMLHEALQRTVQGQLGYLLSRGAFADFRRRMDSAEYGAAPLLGVGGLCLVGHGRSSAQAIANGIVKTADLARAGLLDRLATELATPLSPEPSA